MVLYNKQMKKQGGRKRSKRGGSSSKFQRQNNLLGWTAKFLGRRKDVSWGGCPSALLLNLGEIVHCSPAPVHAFLTQSPAQPKWPSFQKFQKAAAGTDFLGLHFLIL